MTRKCRILKEAVEFIFALLYRVFLPLKQFSPRRVVVYYHGLSKKDIESFERQMAYLANHCHVVKASEIMTASPDGVKVIVSVTFDDASVSSFENALPILKKYRLPAAIFVPTGNLGGSPRWALEESCPDADEIIMSKEQIAEVEKLGFEVFSHTVSHPYLTRIGDNELKFELNESRQTLEGIVGHDVSVLSYPHGDFDGKVCRAANEIGYRMGFTVEPDIISEATDALRVGRVKVLPSDGLFKFKLKVSGAYQIVSYLRRLKWMFMHGLLRRGKCV